MMAMLLPYSRIVALAALVLATPLCAGDSTTPSDEELRRRIDAVFAEWDRWDSPGAAVVVVRDGEVFYQRGYGSAQLEYSIPITPSTVFHVASVSKQFTCMVIELLARDGKLSWDDEVHRYLPELPDYGTPITLRHLANHTSGIRDQWELLAMAGWRLDDVITREHILRMVYRQRELNYPPGAEYVYSNSGYSLLAEVATKASGKTFRELAAERVFRPLGMSRTHVHDDMEEIVPGRAYSYSPKDGGGFRNSVLSFSNQGATSLFTTVEDMARWLRNFETGAVGGKAAIESLTTPGVLTSGKTIDYALGLSVGKFRGTRVVSHAGSDAGFRSFLLWLPEHRVGAVVLANLASINTGALAQSVIDAVIGDQLDALPKAGAAAQPSATTRPSIELPVEVLDEFVGAYQLDIGPMVTISRDGSTLKARQPIGEDSTLLPLSETELLMQAPGILLTFERDPGKPAPGFKGLFAGQPFEGKRIEPLPITSLTDVLGDYWSEELQTSYRIMVDGHRLIARHPRHTDTVLYGTTPDHLVGDAWWFGSIAVTRDTSGKVDGLRVTGNRVRNVRFVRRP